MLGLVGQARLASLLQQLAQGEKKVQAARLSLAVHPLFHPLTAFRRIDRAKKGSILPADLDQFLNDNGIYPSPEQSYILFKSFDCLRIGQIGKDDFIKTIMPFNDLQSKASVAKRQPAQVSACQRLPTQVQFNLTRLFQQIILNHRIAQVSRSDLHSSTDYSPTIALQTLDSNRDSVVTKDQIDSFLRANGRTLSKQTIDCILRVIDEDRDGVIKPAQLFQALNPFDNYPYPGYGVSKRSQALNNTLKRSRLAQDLEKQQVLDSLRRSRLESLRARKLQEDRAYELARHNQIELQALAARSRMQRDVAAQQLIRSRRLNIQRERAVQTLARQRELQLLRESQQQRERIKILEETKMLNIQREKRAVQEREKALEQALKLKRLEQLEEQRKRAILEEQRLKLQLFNKQRQRQTRLAADQQLLQIRQLQQRRERLSRVRRESSLTREKLALSREIYQKQAHIGRAKQLQTLLTKQKIANQALSRAKLSRFQEETAQQLSRSHLNSELQRRVLDRQVQRQRELQSLQLELTRSKHQRGLAHQAMQIELQKIRLESEARRQRLLENIRGR